MEFLRDLLIRTQGSILVLPGILAVHGFLLLYGRTGGPRGLRTVISYLAAFDWGLMMGVTAGRSVAGEGVPFWSWHTVGWGLRGVFLVFVPMWLIASRMWLRFGGVLLLPVMPTDREQRHQAGQALRAYRWGLNYPFYREEDGELREVVDGRVTLLGEGPGFVMTSSHYAALITDGMQDRRVDGPGFFFTDRWERPRCLIDLRPQVRAKTLHALTRDGIPVRAMMFVVFQIGSRGAENDGLHPPDPEAVPAAVHAQGVRTQDGEQRELGWDQVVVDQAADLVQDAIARTWLDELLSYEDGRSPRAALRENVTPELTRAMKPLGIHILAVGLGNIDVEDRKVLEQRVESWRAHWKRQRLEKEAQGEAEAIRLREKARADAQRQMIMAITEAFQQLADTQTPFPTDVIALRLIGILEEMAAAPVVRELLPEHVSDIPGRLRFLVASSASDEGEAGQ